MVFVFFAVRSKSGFSRSPIYGARIWGREPPGRPTGASTVSAPHHQDGGPGDGGRLGANGLNALQVGGRANRHVMMSHADKNPLRGCFRGTRSDSWNYQLLGQCGR
jgi:hypothetical protein